MENKCAFGLTETVASGLSYVLGWVSGIVFFVAEKDNRNVRFNALQSIITFGGLGIIQMVVNIVVHPLLRWIPLIGLPIAGLLSWALGVLTLVCWLYLVVSAFTGKQVKLPIIGEVCWQQVNK